MLLLGACKTPEHTSKVIKMELHENWQFRQKDEGEWLPATVPGTVHTDLMANKKIEDPFYRDNEAKVQWIEERDWEYKTTFKVDKVLLEKRHFRLIFHGLDTYAKVFLNDAHILTTDNMFREWPVEVKEHLKEGDNHLYIHFISPVNHVKQHWETLGYELPGGPKVLTRKPGYHYGWDWGPRLTTSGAWKPVELQAWDGARIEDLFIKQESLTKERARLTAFFEIRSDTAQEAVVAIEQEGAEPSEPLAKIETNLLPGINRVSFSFEILNPKLWWTNGLGEAYLYPFKGSLTADGDYVDDMRRRLGLRTVELVVRKDQTPGGEPGETFYIKLNGVPVFMKGANYIPQDNFAPRVTKEQYKALIDDAKAVHMNMLRVWGGGIYENQIFYDLCDEAGILVWQDFMFACAMYPGENEFFENVKQEAIDNVRRLRHHTCLALWCGNNEVHEAWFNWGWQDPLTEDQRARIWEDYQAIFHRILPQVVSENDPARYYWPSSPKFSRGSYRGLREGDNHYWGVWHDEEPFSVFNEKIGRFMSEHGFQAFPSMETIEGFTLPEDRSYDSPVMMVHQKHPRGNQLIHTYMKRDYQMPGSFEHFVYLSQVLQAEGMKIGMEAQRRAMPYCMGSLYWQLNDCWPVVSWSGRDYHGNWKALHYYAKRGYAPILVSPVEDKETFKVVLVSDLLQPVKGVLTVVVTDFTGAPVKSNETPVSMEANSSQGVYEIETKALLSGRDKRDVVAKVSFKRDNGDIFSNLYYFAPPRKLRLFDPEIATRINKAPGTKRIEIALSSRALARHVYLEMKGIKGHFSDNFFDLPPGPVKTVQFIAEKDLSLEDISNKLKITSLSDTVKKVKKLKPAEKKDNKGGSSWLGGGEEGSWI
jgi:beta-mannosidase